MNTKILIGSLLFTVLPDVVAAEVIESSTWSKIYTVSSATPKLSVNNIWGNVRVRPGKNGEITVSIDERRSAPDQDLFNRSLELLKLETYSDAAGVSMTVSQRDNRWQSFEHCNDCRVDYQFEVTVPPGTLVDVSTVMDGKVDVSGVNGVVSASNVNGPVQIADLHDCTKVKSVNGAVELSFARAPGQNCEIETINGDVIVQMPPGSGVNLALSIFNGKVFTDFATDSMALPADVTYEEQDGVHRYRVQQTAGLRLEGGGPTFSVSSLNGDVRFRKN
jgi:hypothetical protein